MSPNVLSWYAIFTKPHCEKIVSASLRGKGYEEFLPLYPTPGAAEGGQRKRSAPLFPRYLFCRFDVTKRLPILTTPGVMYVVSSGRELLTVGDEEIGAIQSAAQADLNMAPVPYLEDGQRVVLTGGPLKGTEGVLLSRKSQHQLVVGISLLRRAVAVEIDIAWARPAEPARSHAVV